MLCSEERKSLLKLKLAIFRSVPHGTMMGRKRRRKKIHTFNFFRLIWYRNKARSSYFCSILLSIHPALSQTATRALYIPFKTSSQGYQLWQRPDRHLWRHSVTKNCRQLTRRGNVKFSTVSSASAAKKRDISWWCQLMEQMDFHMSSNKSVKGLFVKMYTQN